jgi:NAD(P)-dependent dehydrogenase (short-subunit alcohol dehydrogenase family)
VALITGAASGIGRATAHTFVSEGCTRLIISDINELGLKVVSAELKSLDPDVQVCIVVANVASETDVNRMVEEGVAAFGAIHYAVNNAGVSSKPRVRTDELEVKSYDDVMAVNLRGVWLCERAELRQMLKQEKTLIMRCGCRPYVAISKYTLTYGRTGAPPQRGAIVNISSIFGRISHPNVGAVGFNNREYRNAAVTKFYVPVCCRKDWCSWHIAYRCCRVWQRWDPCKFRLSWWHQDPAYVYLSPKRSDVTRGLRSKLWKSKLGMECTPKTCTNQSLCFDGVYPKRLLKL